MSKRSIPLLALTRVSTTNQANVQHGSLEQQESSIKRLVADLCERTGHNYFIYKSIESDISGKREVFYKREDIQLALNLIKNKKISGIVIEKLDRLGRYQRGILDFMERAQDANIEVWECETGQKINLRDRGSRLSFNVKNMTAEDYSLDLKEKIERKQRGARVNNGKDTNTVPILGFDPHPKKVGMYVPNQSELEIIKDIMEKFCEFSSYTETVLYCNQKNYLTKVRFTKQIHDREGNILPPRKVGGINFTHKSLERHLTHKKYRGYGLFSDDWNQFPKMQDENGLVRWNYNHGQVLPEALLRRVDETIAKIRITRQRKGKEGRVYLLSGALKDSDGNLFQGNAANGGRNLYYYNRVLKMRVNKDEIEDLVCKRVKKYLCENGRLSSVVQSVLKSGTANLGKFDFEIQKVKRTIENQITIIERFSETLRQAALSSTQNITQVCEALIEERSKAQIELDMNQSKLLELENARTQAQENFKGKALEEQLNKVLRNFDQRSDFQKKRLIQMIVPEVIVHPDNKIELKVSLDPVTSGIRPTAHPTPRSPCHTGGQKIGLMDKWRGGRDLNPRPPA